MTHLVPKRIRIEKDIVVRTYRNLQGKGKISVSIGQEVTPEEIIGSSEFSSGFRTLNLSTLLGVSPNEAGKYLKKKLGSRIYKGELLAYKSAWLFKKPSVITCPTDGILDFINEKSGEVRIMIMPQKLDLPAGVYGIVEACNNTLGQVVIRTQVSKVYGVCGSGRMRDGILQILTKRDDFIGKTMIVQKLDGHILVNGSLISKESIIAAISNDVSGIITGGINASDYKSFAGGRMVFPKKLENDIGISILICEGFGSQPLGEDIYEILSKYEGRFVTIDGNHSCLNLPSYQSSCMIKLRKTQLPNLEPPSLGETQFVELSLGQRVRVVGPTFSAEQGKIIAIDKSLTLLPSGTYAYLTTIETRRRKIKVPTNNIEVIA